MYLAGKKTYILSALMVIYALLGVFLKQMDIDTALQLAFPAGIGVTIRIAIAQGIAYLQALIESWMDEEDKVPNPDVLPPRPPGYKAPRGFQKKGIK